MNNLVRYQDNINNYSVEAPRVLDFRFKCYSFLYLENDIQSLESSNKIILPNTILRDLSKYNDIEYPLHFKINDSEILFTPSEFKEYIDDIFIPQHFIDNLGIEIGSQVKLTLLNYQIEKGSKVKIKPHTSNFLEIIDHKHFLERHLVKLYSTLTQGQTIKIPYEDSDLLIDILECEPRDTVSIVDTDLEVDFEAPYDYVEEKEVEKELKGENFKDCFSKFKLGRFNFSNNVIKPVEITEEKEEKFVGNGRILGNK